MINEKQDERAMKVEDGRMTKCSIGGGYADEADLGSSGADITRKFQ